MPKEPQTSRDARRYRTKDANAPIARYCAAAIKKYGGSAAKLAAEMGLTRSAPTQWATGLAHPSLENLIDLSLKSGLSLGYLSALSAEYQNVDVPHLGEIEGRYALLSDVLRPTVIAALDSAETLEQSIPREALRRPVANERLDDVWRNPDSDHPKQKK